MGQITHIKINCNDSSKISPIELLEVTKEEYETGELKGKKIFIICLDDEDDCFNIRTRAAGCRCSEILPMIESAKSMILNQMGY